MNASGYMVVRLPEWNEAVPDGPILPALNSTRYCGIDRCEWVDAFDEDYYGGTLPAALRNTLAKLEGLRVFKSGVLLTPNLEEAFELLRYANRTEEKNEVIAVRFTSDNAPPVAFSALQEVEWIGFDLYAESQWSLIARGLFTSSGYYDVWRAKVNQFGLFDSKETFASYEKFYRDAVEKSISEELAGPEAGFAIVAIEVGRLR